MIDFSAVSGADYSAVNALSRALETASAADVKLVLAALPEHLLREFERNLPSPAFAKLIVEPDAERALARCEDIVIEAWNADENLADQRRAKLLEEASDDLERRLERQIRFEELIDELGDWLEAREYAAGETLAGSGARPDEELQLLLSGRASAYDAAGARLYQCEPGDVVEPAGTMAERGGFGGGGRALSRAAVDAGCPAMDGDAPAGACRQVVRLPRGSPSRAAGRQRTVRTSGL